MNKQDVNSNLSRKSSTGNRMLRYKRLYSLFYTDTFYAKKVISEKGFSITQLFVSDNGFIKVYGIKSEKEFVNVL